jgi:hypothetical protein
MHDSLMLANQALDTAFKSSIDNKLGSVQQELQNIKTVLRNQSLMPRYRYLQFQNDSIGRLSATLNARKTLTQSDRLRLRVYELQQDSVKNEMQKLIWMTQYPAKDYDSTLLNFDPLEEMRSGTWPETSHLHKMEIDPSPVPEQPVIYDSLVVLNSYQSKLDQLKSDNLYDNDLGYRSRVDSLEKRFMGSNLQAAASGVKSNDSLDRAYQRKFDAMQKRLDSLERVERTIYQEFVNDSVRNNTRSSRRSVDTIRAKTSRDQQIRDTVAASDQQNDTRSVADTRVQSQEVGSDTQSEQEKNTTDSLERALQESNNVLRQMQSQIKATRDSAAYYRRTMYARDLSEEDTVVTKRRWY